MPMIINNFGGMIPRTQAHLLPDNGAALARNCLLSSGALRPLALAGSARALTAGEVHTDYRKSILVPSKPTLVTPTMICDPGTGTKWLKSIIAYRYWDYIDGSGVLQDQGDSYELSIDGIQYTDDGLIIKASFADTSKSILCYENTPTNIYGPKFQFVFDADDGGTDGAAEYGGPNTAATIPASPVKTSPALPGGAVPLFWGIKPYGSFQLVDVDCLFWDTQVTYGADTNHQTPGDEVTFYVNLGYHEPRYRQYHFVSTNLDRVGTTDEYLEGPPSELSDLIVVKPGQNLALTIDQGDGMDKVRLYRSDPGSGRYFLASEQDGTSWVDDGSPLQPEELPAYGNPNDETDFFTNSIIHPAQFAATFEDGESILYLSDVFRHHAWPEEYAIQFNEAITAIALSGNTILVFSATKVWAVAGSNPAYMGKYMVTDAHPLKEPATLARIGQTVYYVCEDGLAAANGASVQVISGDFFTREDWQARMGTAWSSMKAYTADRSLFIEGGTVNLRFDMGEGIKTVSEYEGSVTDTPGGDIAWTSKTWLFDREVTIDYVRVDADEAVSLTINSETPQTISSGLYTPLTVPVTSKSITATLESSAAGQVIRSLEIYEREVLLVQGSVSLTRANVRVWENIWLKFADKGRFVAGSLSAQTDEAVTITFTNQDTDASFDVEVTSGRAFRIPRSVTDNTDGSLWKVKVYSASGARIDGLMLFAMSDASGDGGIRDVNPANGIPPWFFKRYLFTGGGVVSGRVNARDYSVLSISFYSNLSETATTIALGSGTDGYNGREFRIDGLETAAWLEYDFGGNDDAVQDVTLFEREAWPVDNGGVIIRNGIGRKTWRKKYVQFPEMGGFSVLRVEAAKYPVLVSFNGGSTYTQVADNDEIKLPATLGLARRWEIDVKENDGAIHELHLIGLQAHAVAGESVTIRRENGPFSWLGHRIISINRIAFTCGRVVASEYPVTMKVFKSDELIFTKVIYDGRAFRLPRMQPGRMWGIDMDVEDGIILEEVALATNMGRLGR